jgi:hypothetical protein
VQGLGAYQAGDWEKARANFEASSRLRTPDRAAHLVLDRVAILRARPADDSWNGVWKLVEK